MTHELTMTLSKLKMRLGIKGSTGRMENASDALLLLAGQSIKQGEIPFALE
jgi:hypothetical protein